MNDTTDFLIEYEALCRKYKVGVLACGCCGSPWLTDLDTIDPEYPNWKFKTTDDHIKHLKDS